MFYNAHNVRNAQSNSCASGDTLRATYAIHPQGVQRARRVVQQSTTFGGEGGVLTIGYPAYRVVQPGVQLVPWVGMADASATLTVSFRPVTPMQHYTSWVSPKHLMCMCFSHAPHAQRVLPLRQCVQKRRLAERFGACTVWTAAGGVVLLNSAPRKYGRLRVSHWNSHMVVFPSTNPNALAVAKAILAAHSTMKARTAWLQVICLPSWRICYAIWLAPSTAREYSRQHATTGGRGFPLRSLATSSPYQRLVRKGTKRSDLCPTFWVLVHGKFILLVRHDCPCHVAVLGKGGRPCKAGISLTGEMSESALYTRTTCPMYGTRATTVAPASHCAGTMISLSA